MAKVNDNNVTEVLGRFKRDRTWMAKKFKVARPTVWRWEQRNNIPAVHHDRILYIARKYEVPVSARDLV